MPNVICITCDGRRTIAPAKVASWRDRPNKTVKSSDRQKCPTCKGEGRVPLNP